MVFVVDQDFKETYETLYKALSSSESSYFQESIDILDQRVYTSIEKLGLSYLSPIDLHHADVLDCHWFKLAVLTRFPGLLLGAREYSFEQYQRYVLDELMLQLEEVLNVNGMELASKIFIAAICSSRTIFGESLYSEVKGVDSLRPHVLTFLGDINPIYKTCFLYRSEYVDAIVNRISGVMEEFSGNMLKAVFLSRIQKREGSLDHDFSFFSSMVDEVSNMVFTRTLLEYKKREHEKTKSQNDESWLNFYKPAIDKDTSLEIANQITNLWSTFKGEKKSGIDGLLKLIALSQVFWDGYLVALGETKSKFYERSVDGLTRVSLSGRLYFRNLLDNITDPELKSLLILTKPYLLFKKEEVKGFFIIGERNIYSHSQCEQSYYFALLSLLEIFCEKSFKVDDFIKLIDAVSAPCLDYYLYEDIEVDELILNMSTAELSDLPPLERSAITEILGHINVSKFSSLDGLFAKYLCDYLSAYRPQLLPIKNKTSSRLFGTSI